MLDWDNDPELKAIRDEFIASLEERRGLLSKAIAGGDFEVVQGVAHKVAGTAASYGFPSLTKVGEVIDDYLDLFPEDGSRGKPDPAFVGELARMLDAFLADALQRRTDRPEMLVEAAYARVISSAESSLAAARS